MGKSGNTRRWTFGAGVAAVTAGTVLAVGGLAIAPAGADHVDPVDTENDNPTCEDLGYTYEFKIDGVPADGDYDVTAEQSGIEDGGTVTIANAGVVEGVFYFDWSSDIGWNAVIVKQGDGATAYTYNPQSEGDTGLHPSTTNGQPTGGVSHVTFCRDDAPPPPPPDSSDTTEEETTTTVEETTTSETVLGSTVTQGEQPTTSASVKGVVINRQLPRTGAASELMTYAAVVLIAAGLALLATSKRSLSAHR